MQPLVSILIPAYNAEHWLADTIKSALNQTWSRTEIIVVNDGSSDGTLQVAQSFASAKVTVVSQVNQGAAATRNNLLALSRGDYIQWLDADDLLSEEKIARQLKALEESGPSERTLLSSAWGYFYYRPSKADFRFTPLWSDLSPLEWMLRKMEQNLHMQTATWLVSRKLTESAGPWNTQLLGDDDGEYFARVVKASDHIRFVPEAKVFYRRSGFGQLSYIGRSNKKIEAQYRSMQLNIDYIRSIDDGLRTRAACVTYLQNWLPAFYPERLDIVNKAKELAETLGGKLESPKLRKKYMWLEKTFGQSFAKRAQLYLPRTKWSLVRFWDKMLFHLQA